MAEYIDKQKYREEWLKFKTFEPMKCLDSIPIADVIERSKIDKAIDNIKELYTEWENLSDDAKLEPNPFGAVLNIIQRNIGE